MNTATIFPTLVGLLMGVVLTLMISRSYLRKLVDQRLGETAVPINQNLYIASRRIYDQKRTFLKIAFSSVGVIVLIGMLLPSNALAQANNWVSCIRNNDICYSAGNVGIGTTNPSFARLESHSAGVNKAAISALNGPLQIFMVPWLNDGGYNFLSSPGDKGIFWSTPTQRDNSTGSLVIAPWVNAKVGIKITREGNVGIGTSNPVAPLSVMQTVRGLTTGLEISSHHTPNVNAGAVINAWDADHQYVRPLTLQNDGGNVGIGTTNPQARLDVAGSANVDGELTLLERAAFLTQTDVNNVNLPGIDNVSTHQSLGKTTYQPTKCSRHSARYRL